MSGCTYDLFMQLKFFVTMRNLIGPIMMPSTLSSVHNAMIPKFLVNIHIGDFASSAPVNYSNYGECLTYKYEIMN